MKRPGSPDFHGIQDLRSGETTTYPVLEKIFFVIQNFFIKNSSKVILVLYPNKFSCHFLHSEASGIRWSSLPPPPQTYLSITVFIIITRFNNGRSILAILSHRISIFACKLLKFKQTVLRAQEELVAHLWIYCKYLYVLLIFWRKKCFEHFFDKKCWSSKNQNRENNRFGCDRRIAHC